MQYFCIKLLIKKLFMRKIKTLIVFCVLSLVSLFMSKVEAKNNSKEKLDYSKTIDFSYAANYLSFTDFATSPLTYSSFVNSLSLAYHKEHVKRTTILGLKFDMGSPSVSYNNTASAASYMNLDLYYKRLYRINQSIDKLSLKVGGMVSLGGDMRTNDRFNNAGFGMDINTSLSLSGRASWDISRLSNYTFDWWFFHIKRGPVTRHLILDCDLGLLGAGLRNGYTYVNQSGLADSEGLLSGYNVVYAPRMRGALGYQVTFKNHNFVSLSYVWDAIKYKGSYEPYQVASHGIQLTFGFNTNNK